MTDLSHYDDAPECWKQFYEIMESGIDRAILNGPPGTGKTFAGLNVGQIDRGAFRLICTETMTEFEIQGGWMPEEGSFTYYEGVGPKAWRGDGISGGRLVIDEIDKANGDPLGVLLAFTDSPDSAKWQHPMTKRIERPMPGFSVIATTNMENLEDLPPALRDRFPVSIRINEPHPAALELLPTDLRSQARKTADAGENSISLRAWFAFAQLRDRLGADRAAQILFKDKAQSIADALRIQAVEA